MGKYIYGADLGGTTVKLGVFLSDGTLLEDWQIPTRTENKGSHILDDIAEAILSNAAKRGIDKQEISGVGLCVPGPVTDEGVVLGCVNLGWGIFDVKTALSDRIGLPVMAANDANAAALGEMWKGGGVGRQNLVMVTLGTGIGGGIISRGKILAGRKGAAGEIGHMVVNINETIPCGCGKRGCLEQYCSASGVANSAKRYLLSNDRPTVLRQYENLTSKELMEAAAAGDEVACDIRDQFGLLLGAALSHVACVEDPEVFVIGGGMSKAGAVLLESVKENYRRYAFPGSRDADFVVAGLGNQAGIYGCAKMVLQQENVESE